MNASSTSLLPGLEDERLQRIPLKRLLPHPANANLMSEERLKKLARNIEREGRYPPLIVRPHPQRRGYFELLDGHQRCSVLGHLGLDAALCYLWRCDDETALVLLSTLNRLEGEDLPAKRAELLSELRGLMPLEEMARLLPESAKEIQEALDFKNLDSAALLAQLTRAAEVTADSLRAISFAVSRDDEQAIEEAVRVEFESLSGPNRRGRALANICRAYLESRSA